MRGDEFRVHALLHSADLVEHILRKRLAPLGLHPRQARILHALALMEEASQARLVREFDVTAASMSTMTARLIEAGYVKSRQDPDEHRARILELTDEGRSKLADIYEVWGAMSELIVDVLGAKEAQALFALTSELRAELGGRIPGLPRPKRRSDKT